MSAAHTSSTAYGATRRRKPSELLDQRRHGHHATGHVGQAEHGEPRQQEQVEDTRREDRQGGPGRWSYHGSEYGAESAYAVLSTRAQRTAAPVVVRGA